jgi:hypothetical protein
MKHSRLFLPLLCTFALLFAQQAGAAHTLRHVLEYLKQQLQDKQSPHSDACDKCVNYAQLASALNVAVFDFAPPRVSSETIQHLAIAFRSIRVFAAESRAPPFSA